MDWIITPAELRKVQNDVVLVDVREPDETAEGFIQGAKLIPLGEIQTRGPRELNPADDIVLYCAHGVRSLQAVMALRMLGFEHLRSLEGGYEHWKEEKGV